MKLSELKLNPDNPRHIKPEKLDKLAQSIKDFPKMMVKRPIVYDENKVIIGGNMRYRAIQSLGMTEIPDEWTSDASDFTTEERHRFIMQDNAEMGEHDWDMVANQYELEDLEAWGIDVPYADSTEEVEEDEAPEVSSEPPVSQLGVIYQLGRHRVMCGDSTKDVAKLMDEAKADFVLVDPPYGMYLDTDFSGIKGTMGSTDATHGTKGKKYDNVIGDHDDFDPELITTIFDNFEFCDEMFIFGADYFAELLPDKNNGSWCVWDKRKDSQADAIGSEFELIWSKQKHKRRMLRHDWFGFLSSENTQDARNRVHPTQKPITLLVDILNQWGTDCKTVADIYLGSGSTLIACEQTDRTCYGMELDEKYLDVIRKRWAKYVYPDRWEKEWEILTPAIEKL